MPAMLRFVCLALALLVCGGMAACAGKTGTLPDAGPDAAGAGDATAARRGEQPGPLPPMPVAAGTSVHVTVSGVEPGMHEDLVSMLTAYLQSERQLVPATSGAEKGLRVRIAIDKVMPLGSENAPVSAGAALGGAATGAMLGAMLGGLADSGGSGAAIGAGGGLLLGLGTVWLDSRGRRQLWAMHARVGMALDRAPADEAMHPVQVMAQGAGMSLSESLPALEDALCRDIVAAIAPLTTPAP